MKDTIEKNIQYAVSTFAVEKLTPSREAIQLCRTTALGQKSLEDAIFLIKQKYGIKDKGHHV